MKKSKLKLKIRRHARIRSTISGTPERLRVAVFRSNKYISAQAIDDVTRKTIASEKGSNKKPEVVGETLAKRLVDAGVKKIVFDRGGYKYHGRVKALAEALRKSGIEF